MSFRCSVPAFLGLHMQLFLKITKLDKSFENEVWGISRSIFNRKWCAALSSVVSLRAPSGKKSASTQMWYFQKLYSRLTPELKISSKKNLVCKIYNVWQLKWRYSIRNSAEITLNFFVFLPSLRCHFGPNSKIVKILPWASKQKFLIFWHNFDEKMVRSTLLCRFSEGPFGQKISFNTNVVFSKIV